MYVTFPSISDGPGKLLLKGVRKKCPKLKVKTGGTPVLISHTTAPM